MPVERPPLRYPPAADVEAAMPPIDERLALADLRLRSLVADAELPAKIAVHPRPPSSFAHAMPAYLRGPSPDQATRVLIRCGRIVNADGTLDADLLITGERIAAIAPGLPADPGTRIIDARGLLVMPGGIDPHAHIFPPFADDPNQHRCRARRRDHHRGHLLLPR